MESQLTGLVAIILGFALRYAALVEHRRAGIPTYEILIPHVPRKVIRTGPYQWLSHPMYVGTLLVVAGAGVMALGWGGMALAVATVPWMMDRIVLENRLVKAVDGAA